MWKIENDKISKLNGQIRSNQSILNNASGYLRRQPENKKGVIIIHLSAFKINDENSN